MKNKIPKIILVHSTEALPSKSEQMATGPFIIHSLRPNLSDIKSTSETHYILNHGIIYGNI